MVILLICLQPAVRAAATAARPAAVTFFSAQKKRLFCAPENPIIFFAITQEEIRQTTGFAYLFGEYYPFPRQNIFFSDLSF
jgi:hypothetical protein